MIDPEVAFAEVQRQARSSAPRNQLPVHDFTNEYNARIEIAAMLRRVTMLRRIADNELCGRDVFRQIPRESFDGSTRGS